MNEFFVLKFSRLRFLAKPPAWAIIAFLALSFVFFSGSQAIPAQAQGPTPVPPQGKINNPPPVSLPEAGRTQSGLPTDGIRTAPQAKAPRVLAATWVAQGPGPTTGGQVEGMPLQNNPVAGAVDRIVAHPTNPDILWITGVNGGIWKTTNATNTSPTWTPLSDQASSLSMSALELDPTDATFQTLVAGMGHLSSLGYEGGGMNGLLRSTDGGTTWTPLGVTELSNKTIIAVQERGAMILAAAYASSGAGGLWRSMDTGASFTLISGGGGTGLPAGGVFDLVGDPGNQQRFYAAVAGQGIYLSDDNGATWADASGAKMFGTGVDQITGAVNIKIATGSANVVYVAIALRATGKLASWFRSANLGATWTAIDVPSPTIHPGGQAYVHFSLVADPNNANLVYIGGDRQDQLNFLWPNAMGATNYTGNLFRCDTSLGAGTQCSTLTHNGTAHNSAPHADSRKMVFDANGNIIEGDDGGIYRRVNPTSTTGDWVPVIGNIQVTESHHCAYDSIAGIIICGNQDTGTAEQTTAGSTTWRQVMQGDGGKVAVDNSGALSIRYSSYPQLGSFRSRTCNAANVCNPPTYPALVVNGTGGLTLYQFDTLRFIQPFELNKVNPARILIGTRNLYESLDRGQTLTYLGAAGGLVTAMAYGGKSGGVNNESVLYYGTDGTTNGSLFLRTTGTGLGTKLTAYTGITPVGIVLDPDDWNRAYVIDKAWSVWQTLNAGASFTDITGNLGLSSGQRRTIEFMPQTGAGAILVGTDVGVFMSSTAYPSFWDQVGSNLPRVVVYDLHYDPTANILLAGTLGRGAWIVNNATSIKITSFPLFLPLITR